MLKNTYAVVDIETTGTDPKNDRIIQFGCVLVENGNIVSTFATDVNPGKVVSKQIQQLTGITNQQLKKAPYFEDIAMTIYHLLAETTFVAHNIYFDYPFISRELKRCGAPVLTIPGIDTVELSQIFLPTEASFRLTDLAHSLNLTHDRPHQADSDAFVTAELLIKIAAEMRKMPLVTMAEIVKLSQHTGKQTTEFIAAIYEEMQQQPAAIKPGLVIVDGLALKTQQVDTFATIEYQTQPYPRKKRDKEKLFHGQLEFRKAQSRLMNLVYDHFTNEEEKNLMIEAATGSGKTLGYLLPLSFLATPAKPAVISTVSLLLQRQILEEDLPKLNALLPQPFQATVLKSPRHYLDLERFKASLITPVDQKQYALYQMAVLVWLTQTTTGDFSELHMTNLKHQFWQDVGHRGSGYLKKESPLYDYDFWELLQERVAQSNLIIVNHAFLVQEDHRQFPLLPKAGFLLIDEAHHLPEIASAASQVEFVPSQIRKQWHHHRGNQLASWQEVAQMLPSGTHSLELLAEELDEITEELFDFEQEFPLHKEEVVLSEADFADVEQVSGRFVQHLQVLYPEVMQLIDQLLGSLATVSKSLTDAQLFTTGRMEQYFLEVKNEATIFMLFTNHWQGRYLHSLKASKKNLTLSLQDLAATDITKTQWYQQFDRICYLSGSLQLAGNRHYFPKRLGIPDTLVKLLPNPYDYAQKARLYVPTDAPQISAITQVEYSKYLAGVLTRLAQSQDRPIMVLFTSHELLQSVYHKLKVPFLNEGRDLFAQGIGGSREKLLKKFRLSQNGILFGADSFWEGVDLPGATLEIVVVTRLPFENPNRPLVKARNEYLKTQGIDPFFEESIPKSALRLRQALGRLIRSESDRGILLVMDNRLLTASYSSRLLKALPKELPLVQEPLTATLANIQTFLAEDLAKKAND
jgi:ATP-dependent DNA helicase DinG